MLTSLNLQSFNSGDKCPSVCLSVWLAVCQQLNQYFPYIIIWHYLSACSYYLINVYWPIWRGTVKGILSICPSILSFYVIRDCSFFTWWGSWVNFGQRQFFFPLPPLRRHILGGAFEWQRVIYMRSHTSKVFGGAGPLPRVFFLITWNWHHSYNSYSLIWYTLK